MIHIEPEFRTVYFAGKDWPQFQVREARRNRDGAPAIYCVAMDGRTFGITVERFLFERRNGGIIRLAY